MSTGTIRGLIPYAFVVIVVSAFAVPALAPLLIPATVLIAWWFCSLSVSQARSWGLRSSAVPLIWLFGVLWSISEAAHLIVAYPTPLRQIDLVLEGVAVLALVVGAFAPKQFVRFTGGPSAEWLLLRERAAIAFGPSVGRDDTTPAEEAAFEARLRDLDRYRSPRTAEFIDLFQEWFRMPEPTPETTADQQRWLDHFHAVEWSLFLSLKVRPSWYDTYPWLRGVRAAPSEPLAGNLSGR
jgi:hypothetical protein